MTKKAELTAEEAAAETERVNTLVARHKKRVERRAKYLATLSAKQRKARDVYVGWLTQWRRKYRLLALQIHANKQFVRAQGHNDLKALKACMTILASQRHEAHALLLGRMMYKAQFALAQAIAATPKVVEITVEGDDE